MLQSMGWQRAGYDLVTVKQQQHRKNRYEKYRDVKYIIDVNISF